MHFYLRLVTYLSVPTITLLRTLSLSQLCGTGNSPKYPGYFVPRMHATSNRENRPCMLPFPLLFNMTFRRLLFSIYKLLPHHTAGRKGPTDAEKQILRCKLFMPAQLYVDTLWNCAVRYVVRTLIHVLFQPAGCEREILYLM